MAEETSAKEEQVGNPLFILVLIGAAIVVDVAIMIAVYTATP